MMTDKGSFTQTLTNEVRNKETDEQMQSRNTGTGQDSNLERPDEGQYHNQ